MSDYYGAPTLEDWLAEEVFAIEKAPPEIVALFEKWREGIEGDIESWMNSDDGDGNNLSWRGWGRGFSSIPDDDETEFDYLIEKAFKVIACPTAKG